MNDPATIGAGSVDSPAASSAPDQRSVREPHGDDDASDVGAALRGDDAAFARLYDRHAPIVLAICRRSSSGSSAGSSADPAEADDALQETFIRAHRQLPTLDAPGRVRSWLLGIARRVCSERRRAGGRRRRHEETAMTIQTARASESRRAADERVAEVEALARLGAALDHLPEAERLAIHLYYLDPDPVRAAADELGLSRSGFYKLLGRARDRLRGLLDDVLPAEAADPSSRSRSGGHNAHGGQPA